MPATYIDPSPADHTATVEVPISPKAELSISKTVLTPLGTSPPARRSVSRSGAQLRPQQRHRRRRAGHLLGRLHRCDLDLHARPTAPGPGRRRTAAGNLTVGECRGQPERRQSRRPAPAPARRRSLIVGAVVASPSSGVLSNVAKVIVPSGVFDPSTGNNTPASRWCSKPRPTSRSSRPTAPRSPVPGEPITYSITVFNTGPDDAQALEVNDLFPPELRNVSWTCNSAAPA